LHHGRNSDDGHDAGEGAHARKEVATDWAELSGNYHTRAMQDWNYARAHSQARQHWRDLALRNTDVRSGLAVNVTRLWTINLHWDRWRSDSRSVPPRLREI